MKNDLSKKIAYGAICTALSVVVVIATAFTPVKIVPLIFVSLCLYIAFTRCGVLYGIVTALATVALSFALTGVSLSFVALVALFLPYAVVAFLMKKLTYDKLSHAIVRLVVSALIFALAFVIIVNLVDIVAGTSLTVIMEKIGKVGAIIALVVIALPVDFFFLVMANKIIKLLK